MRRVTTAIGNNALEPRRRYSAHELAPPDGLWWLNLPPRLGASARVMRRLFQRMLAPAFAEPSARQARCAQDAMAPNAPSEKVSATNCRGTGNGPT